MPNICRPFGGSGLSDDGAYGEAYHDPPAQVGLLPRQLWWRTERLGTPEEDTVRYTSMHNFNLSDINLKYHHKPPPPLPPSLNFQQYTDCFNPLWIELDRSFNWVTPQMLRVPFPDERAEVSDPFLPAITGDLLSYYFVFGTNMKSNQLVLLLSYSLHKHFKTLILELPYHLFSNLVIHPTPSHNRDGCQASTTG